MSLDVPIAHSDFDENSFSENIILILFIKGVTEGGSNSMMAAYNSYNGIPCALKSCFCENVVAMKEWASMVGIALLMEELFKLFND